MRRNQRRRLALFGGNVFGKFQMDRTRTLLPRDAKGFTHQRRDHQRRYDLARQLGERPHRRHDIHDLESRLPRRQNALLPGDHDHRHGTEQRISGAGRQIQRSGPERGDANARLAGEPSVGGGHERGGLLMAGQHELDRGLANRLDHVEVLFPRNAKNPIDAFILEGGDQQIRTFQYECSLVNRRPRTAVCVTLQPILTAMNSGVRGREDATTGGTSSGPM